MRRLLITSESVTEGHPDKMADQISDAILDEALRQDPMSRVAAETLLTRGIVFVSGEITTKAYIDIPKIVREVLTDIGYTRAKYGFDAETCGVITSIAPQSPNIAQGVNHPYEERVENKDEADQYGAGDQGIMYGYATNETDEYLPYPIYLAHKLARRLTYVRKNKILNYLRPDGKSQVTVEYDPQTGKPVMIDAVVISTQHSADVKWEQIKDDVIREVIKPILPQELVTKDTKYYINPTGSFVLGGPAADTGLTGRKIIVDTYGGMAKHGGGAFSGKDPTKVDRSAAYYARYAAKNVVASGLADRCEIQLAYAIGVAHPVSIFINTFGTGKIPDLEITHIVSKVFDFRPASMIEQLDLRKPVYKQVAAYGHFGRSDLDLTWERLDKVEIIKKEANIL